MAMKLSDREQGGIVILEPRGKIMGGPDATLLHDTLYDFIQQGKTRVVIDLGRIEWMNSTGLGILVQSYTTLKNNDGQLKLARITDKIESLLTITKLVTIFESYDTVEDAIGSFQ